MKTFFYLEQVLEKKTMYQILFILITLTLQGFDTVKGQRESGVRRKERSIVHSFSSSPQNLQVPEGSDVSFPCDFNASGPHDELYVLIFKYISPKNEDRIYYAGDIKVTHFPRMKKEGKSFILSNVKSTDSGSYVCRFETTPLTQVVHNLEVLYPPKVWRKGSEIERVRQGSDVLLQCAADGNPTPSISWSKQNGFLPSGLQSVEGYNLTLKEVNRHAEGTYICTASNEIGKASSVSVAVQVEYPPEIVSEKSVIYTGEGSDAKLVCIVHGRPVPDVTWLRGNKLVASDKHLITHDGAHRHILSISGVTEQDFGQYTCNAANSIGRTQHKFELSGLPKKPQITSNPVGNHQNSYRLRWVTETSSPLVQYRLRFRMIHEKDGNRNQWTDKLFFPNNKDISQVRQGVFQIEHLLKNLHPETELEAMVQVENKFGWSLESESLKFRTKKEDPTTTTTPPPPVTFQEWDPKVEEVAFGQSRSHRTRMDTLLSIFLPSLLIVWLRK